MKDEEQTEGEGLKCGGPASFSDIWQVDPEHILQRGIQLQLNAH